jgi:acyl dehydratase
MPLITKDTQEGQEFSGKIRTLTLDRLNFFSGGFPRGPNWPAKNIHTDLEVAKKSGLKTRAASGAMFEGYITDHMIDLFGGDWLNYGTMSLSFIGVVDKDDKLIPRAVVRSKKMQGSEVEFTLDVWCENQHGAKVVVGTARGVIK